MKRMFRLVPIAGLLLLPLGCSPAPSGPVRPLLDGEHAPDVLTERLEIDRPPSLSGNRFLSGWWPLKEGELAPSAAESRIEIVQISDAADAAGAARRLVLDFQKEPPPGQSVRLKAAGRDLGTFPLADPLEIPLPAGLPAGRVAVDLSFTAGSPAVIAGAVRPARPAGGARVQGEGLGQKGDSIVDLVRRVSGGETLVGRFLPPVDPEPGQRFELTVEREDGTPVRRFSWTPTFWNRLRGARQISLPLQDVQGFVRVRLKATGSGPSGEWRGLGFAGGSGGARPAAPAEPEPQKKPADPPRLVIVYVMDALRASTVGHLGGPAGVSPTYDRLAREGWTFKTHRSVAPNTIPSTKSFFTGRTFVSRGGWSLLPEDGPTIAEIFQGAGYRTGLFSGNVYVSQTYGTSRGFEHVAADVLIDGYSAAEKPPYNDNAERAHAEALEWLRSLPPGSRAFLYFHTIHPHNPYDPPEPFRSRYTQGIPSAIDGSTETLIGIKQLERSASPADRRRLRGLYTGAFSYNDAELGRFLAATAGWAPPEETLVALTSDHGEELFEHGGVLHGFTLYEEMLRIPMVLWSPGRLRPGVAVEKPTDTLDLRATLLDLCGLRQPETKGAAQQPGGRSLLAVARAADSDPGYVHFAAASSVKGGIYSAQTPNWKLIWAPRVGRRWGMGDALGRSREPEYLFDLRRDPGERVNRAGHGDLEAAWLRSRMIAWIESGREPDDGTKGGEPAIDPETHDRLRALGYAN